MELTWVAASPSGSQIAIGASNGKLRVWRPNEGRLAYVVDVADFITRALWTRDGRRLLIGTHDGRLVVFGGDSGTLETELATGHGVLRGLAVSADGEHIGTCGDDGKAVVWNAYTLERLVETKAPTVEGSGHAGANAMGFVRAGAIVVGYSTGYFEVFSADGQKSVAGGEVLPGAIDSLAVNHAGDEFVLGGSRGGMISITVDDQGSYRTSNEWRTWPPRSIAANAIDFSSTGAFVVAASDDTARYFSSTDYMDGTDLGFAFHQRTPKPEWTRDFIVSGACFVPGTTLILTSHFDGTLRIWRADGESVAAFRFAEKSPNISVEDRRTLRSARPPRDAAALWASAVNSG